MDLEGYRCSGEYGCMGCMDVGAYGHRVAYRHGGICTWGAMDIWGCMDVWGHIYIFEVCRHMGVHRLQDVSIYEG